jgi:hypothetical protein
MGQEDQVSRAREICCYIIIDLSTFKYLTIINENNYIYLEKLYLLKNVF